MPQRPLKKNVSQEISGIGCVGKNDWRFFPAIIKAPPRAGTVASVSLGTENGGRSGCVPGSKPLRGEVAGLAGQGRPSSRPGAQRGRLTCVAASRARTSRIRKGSRPRPAVQKNRAPAAPADRGSPGTAMAARARPRGARVTWPRACAARPRAPPEMPSGTKGECGCGEPRSAGRGPWGRWRVPLAINVLLGKNRIRITK